MTYHLIDKSLVLYQHLECHSSLVTPHHEHGHTQISVLDSKHQQTQTYNYDLQTQIYRKIILSQLHLKMAPFYYSLDYNG